MLADNAFTQWTWDGVQAAAQQQQEEGAPQSAAATAAADVDDDLKSVHGDETGSAQPRLQFHTSVEALGPALRLASGALKSADRRVIGETSLFSIASAPPDEHDGSLDSAASKSSRGARRVGDLAAADDEEPATASKRSNPLEDSSAAAGAEQRGPSAGSQQQRQPNAPVRTRNVYVAALPLNFSELDLQNLLTPFGKVKSCRIFNNGQHVSEIGRAYGFALFDSPDAAEAAVACLNGQLIGDGRIQCQLSRNGVVKKPKDWRERSRLQAVNKSGVSPSLQQQHQQGVLGSSADGTPAFATPAGSPEAVRAIISASVSPSASHLLNASQIPSSQLAASQHMLSMSLPPNAVVPTTTPPAATMYVYHGHHSPAPGAGAASPPFFVPQHAVHMMAPAAAAAPTQAYYQQHHMAFPAGSPMFHQPAYVPQHQHYSVAPTGHVAYAPGVYPPAAYPSAAGVGMYPPPLTMPGPAVVLPPTYGAHMAAAQPPVVYAQPSGR